MSNLSEMPVVTVEQVVRFREAAMAVEQQRDELLAALQKYGRHDSLCRAISGAMGGKCNCAIGEAIANARGKA